MTVVSMELLSSHIIVALRALVEDFGVVDQSNLVFIYCTETINDTLNDISMYYVMLCIIIL